MKVTRSGIMFHPQRKRPEFDDEELHRRSLAEEARKNNNNRPAQAVAGQPQRSLIENQQDD
jgi:hypothetical protein